MLRKTLLICGILTSLLYVAMNVFIPMLWPSYNSCSQTVSELSAIGAPTRAVWVPFGLLYALLFITFGWGVMKSTIQNRHLRLVGILLLINGVISLAWVYAPMHLREVLAAGGATISDTIHLLFAFVTVLLMVFAIGIGAVSFGMRFRLYSIISLLVLLTFGILTSMDAASVNKNLPTPWIGVWERINIGVFLLWIVVLSVILFRNENLSVKTRTE
ncbi:MAG: DUF998 domain-containing protein [Saprospiraceae bacterium]|uniref:DUF998 domain-containing protein n=1 Tax=Candidatus Opimibacter skivensis TaxID=2982028 RepID=A0A9D7SS27_9BACT|nr:DUF998 domain-containing protein [Candidatus Opimibacter skivensis]